MLPQSDLSSCAHTFTWLFVVVCVGRANLFLLPQDLGFPFNRLKEKKTVVLQCATRAWLARRRANELRKQRMEREVFLREQVWFTFVAISLGPPLSIPARYPASQRLAHALDSLGPGPIDADTVNPSRFGSLINSFLCLLRLQEDSKQQEEAERRRYEIQRRMHPRSAADFEILYNELEAWRLQVCLICPVMHATHSHKLSGQAFPDQMYGCFAGDKQDQGCGAHR